MRSPLTVVLASLLFLGCTRPQELPSFDQAPSFTLTDQLERPLSSDNLLGKVVLANFIFTNCTDICPLLSVRMQQLQDRLRQERLLGSEVQLLSFTVDPARDTPPVLRAYAERHQADPSAWRFLTGPEEQLIPLIVQGFRLGTQPLPPQALDRDEHDHVKNGAETYDVIHSGRFVLIDRHWQIRAYYDGSELDTGRVVGDIRSLLR